MTRRGFIVSAASFASLPSLPAFASGKRDLSKPDLRLGVISDVHLRNFADSKTVSDVLRWYRDNQVDAVVVAGDVADYGLTWQMDAFMGAWADAFPASRNPRKNFEKVELVYVTGNHEFDIWKRITNIYPNANELESRVFVKNIEREWRRLFGEDYAPAFVKTVKGYPFFCVNFLSWDPAEHFKAVKELYAKETAKIPKDRPFFHVQLEDDRSFWRGAFTSVNTATLQHVWRPDGTKELNFPQGLLVRVWPDFVHFERRNFRDGGRFDPAWEREIKQEGKEEA